MLKTVKAKLKKFILFSSGAYRHLRVGIKVNKTWYGNNYGGFYVCPDFLDENAIVYSFGIGEDVSFDQCLIEKHQCKIFGFDPTPKSIEWIRSHDIALSGNFKFFAYGVSIRSGIVDFFLPKNRNHVSGSSIHQNNVDDNQRIEVEMKTVSDIARTLGHKKIDVVKMDIEGAEYEVIDGLLDSGIPIRQLAIEFHDRFFPDGRLRTIKAIERLKRSGFELFGVSDSLEELSFINKNF